jgi:hypothetical protein
MMFYASINKGIALVFFFPFLFLGETGKRNAAETGRREKVSFGVFLCLVVGKENNGKLEK